MSIRTRFHELRDAVGSPRQVLGKARAVVTTARALASRAERDARITRLQAAGLAGERPTDWQLVQAAHHMLFGYILPSNKEFYEHYPQGHWWHQLVRTVDAPETMMDPIGLGISEQTLITHLVQVVHASAGYDVALLGMFEHGRANLRRELEAVVAGTHPRQQVVERLLERPDYPTLLLAALDRFERDPITHWRVDTVPAPAGCDALFDWGIERYGTPGRLLAYALELPATPMASVRAWARGDLRMPTLTPA